MAPGQKAGSLCLSLCGNRLASLSEANSRSSREWHPVRRPAVRVANRLGAHRTMSPGGGGESDTARPSEGL